MTRAAAILAATVALASLGAPAPAEADPRDPLWMAVHRMDQFLQANEVDGVTRDSRNLLNIPEEIRLSVIAQLLGYCELYRADPKRSYLEDIASRANFLLDHFEVIRTRTAFDGMLGYALLEAYQATGDERYLVRATTIVGEALSRRGFSTTLNWGLMAAMACAKYYELTQSPFALGKTLEIVRSLTPYQHPDGSFPHFCVGTRDLHYTAWMGMELTLIGKSVSLPEIDAFLGRIEGFLATRMLPGGGTSYEGPCSDYPGCYRYYYSQRGCSSDYDTRGWINELGYSSLVFDRFSSSTYHDVMAFLRRLEDHGVVADKWDYPPRIDDPIFPWASAEHSVIRTSVVFWSLASVLSARPKGGTPVRYRDLVTAEPKVAFEYCGTPVGAFWGPADLALLDSGGGEATGSRPGSRPGSITVPELEATPTGTEAARPAENSVGGRHRGGLRAGLEVPGLTRGACDVRFVMPREGWAAISVHDVGGRLITRLANGPFGAGQQRATWDLRDRDGRAVAPGLYFVRASLGGEPATARIAVVAR